MQPQTPSYKSNTDKCRAYLAIIALIMLLILGGGVGASTVQAQEIDHPYIVKIEINITLKIAWNNTYPQHLIPLPNGSLLYVCKNAKGLFAIITPLQEENKTTILAYSFTANLSPNTIRECVKEIIALSKTNLQSAYTAVEALTAATSIPQAEKTPTQISTPIITTASLTTQASQTTTQRPVLYTETPTSTLPTITITGRTPTEPQPATLPQAKQPGNLPSRATTTTNNYGNLITVNPWLRAGVSLAIASIVAIAALLAWRKTAW